MKYLILYFLFFFLIIFPTSSFAWHDYDGDWYYYGSGRDYPYSYIVDLHSPGYADYSFTAPDYITAYSPVPVGQVPVVSPAGPNEFTVNIPDAHGGYIPILIKRSGNGFVGPQGEFYPEFPKVFQLKIIYGK